MALERFATYIPQSVRNQALSDCGGCGGDIALVDATAIRRAGGYDLITSVPGYACKIRGNTEDPMCGGIFFPIGTEAAINRSISRFMRKEGKHALAMSFRGVSSRRDQPIVQAELQKAS